MIYNRVEDIIECAYTSFSEIQKVRIERFNFVLSLPCDCGKLVAICILLKPGRFRHIVGIRGRRNLSNFD